MGCLHLNMHLAPQEEEAEESEQEQLVEEWDKAAATEAYREYASIVKEQIQQAEAELAAHMEAEVGLLRECDFVCLLCVVRRRSRQVCCLWRGTGLR